MRTNLIILTILFLFGCSSHRFNSDAERLSKLSYMQNIGKVDCDDITNTSLDDRICLNKKFQEVDSILNERFDEYLDTLAQSKSDSLIKNQEIWIIKRRKKSEEASEGFRGHTSGIIYLETMVKLTKDRIKELKLE